MLELLGRTVGKVSGGQGGGCGREGRGRVRQKREGTERAELSRSGRSFNPNTGANILPLSPSGSSPCHRHLHHLYLHHQHLGHLRQSMTQVAAVREARQVTTVGMQP